MKLQKELSLTQKKCDLLFSRIESKVGRLISTLKDQNIELSSGNLEGSTELAFSAEVVYSVLLLLY